MRGGVCQSEPRARASGSKCTERTATLKEPRRHTPRRADYGLVLRPQISAPGPTQFFKLRDTRPFSESLLGAPKVFLENRVSFFAQTRVIGVGRCDVGGERGHSFARRPPPTEHSASSCRLVNADYTARGQALSIAAEITPEGGVSLSREFAADYDNLGRPMFRQVSGMEMSTVVRRFDYAYDIPNGETTRTGPMAWTPSSGRMRPVGSSRSFEAPKTRRSCTPRTPTTTTISSMK